MTILYIGDIMAEPGIRTVRELLPDLINQEKIDLVIAQAENVSNGRGISLKDYSYLKQIGVDFFTGGNWSTFNEEIFDALNDPNEPIIRPANMPDNTPGLSYKYIVKNNYKVLVISLLGSIVGKDSTKPKDNPLKVIDKILEDKATSTDAIVVNFHGDYSSEKVIIGHYLDGRVSLVVGDHWHVPTADARILPRGTAHISDVGMCGVLNSSLGISLDSVIPRWKNNQKTRNIVEKNGSRQFNAVLVKTTSRNSASYIKQIQKII